MFTHESTMQISDRQLEIIEASGKIITKHGLANLTIKNLASEMGFVESALYRHFKSKEDVIILMIQYLHSNIKERLNQILAQDSKAEVQLKLVFKSQFSFLKANPHFVITMLSESFTDESPKIRLEVMQLVDYKFTLVQGLLERLLHDKSLNAQLNSFTLMHFLIGAFRTLLLRWKMSQFTFDVEIEGNKMVDDFLNLVINFKNTTDD
jgi:AcrR family transcriptional regulator